MEPREVPPGGWENYIKVVGGPDEMTPEQRAELASLRVVCKVLGVSDALLSGKLVFVENSDIGEQDVIDRWLAKKREAIHKMRVPYD